MVVKVVHLTKRKYSSLICDKPTSGHLHTLRDHKSLPSKNYSVVFHAELLVLDLLTITLLKPGHDQSIDESVHDHTFLSFTTHQ